MKRRDFVIGASGLALVACSPDYTRATTEQVKAAYYRHDGPPLIAVLSMVNEWGNQSEHTGILINGDQRVLYDPAGTYDPSDQNGWETPPRKYDIHYGMTDRALKQYIYFHARRGYFVHQQTIMVSRDVANLAIKLSEERGETRFTQCATSASYVLRNLPGFETVRPALLPETIRRDIAKLPGVKDEYFRDNDEGQNYRSAENLEVGDLDDIVPPQKPEYGRGEG